MLLPPRCASLLRTQFLSSSRASCSPFSSIPVYWPLQRSENPTTFPTCSDKRDTFGEKKDSSTFRASAEQLAALQLPLKSVAPLRTQLHRLEHVSSISRWKDRKVSVMMDQHRRWLGEWSWLSSSTAVLSFLLLFAGNLPVADAAYVEFTNCMSGNVVNSDPQLLQFVPLNVSAVFDLSGNNQPLNITVYGNVTGKATDEPYPPPDDPSWNDTTSLFGKIPDFVPGNPAYTTLLGELNVLSYTPYTVPAARFCNTTEQGECPLGPAFYASRYDLDRLPAFAVHAEMNSTYAFTSISAQLRILAGNSDASPYGCIIATITPDLGATLKDLLAYLPLAILIMVGLATIAAATLSPWGSSDTFNWTSNFGRDEDLLRLVTPGFADCLSYIQFIVLTGSLSLNYPGFYQPAVSRVAWSSLMFNTSLVSNSHYTPVVDGIYQYGYRSTYGLDRMTRLVGMGSSRDTWAGMMTWLVVIVVAVVVLTQIGFALRWLYRRVTKVDPEDLRSKNGPFTAGNCIRICLNYFLLPLASLSFYQLVIASRGPSYSVAIAAIVMTVVILFSVRLFFLFLRTKPRSFLFDDLITVLAYGPLYNTYCDDAAMFGLVPVVVNVTRGIAIGAVQPSGVAQLVVLAICEIVMILTLNAFRPFPSATSMNIYHTCFSAIRFITLLLSIAFAPNLEVAAGTRGWIGYAILLIHACVLVFGFFLNAIQTLIEVVARIAGAGGHKDDGSATRGGLVKVFGMRQLSRRVPRHAQQAPTRNSMGSGAAMLERVDTGPRDLHMAQSRTRSVSASSTLLLQQAKNNPARMSQNLDGFSGGQITPDASSTFSKRLTNRFSGQSAGGIVGLQKPVEKKDPYYRPPRRNTMDALNSPDKRTSADWSNQKAGLMSDDEAIADDDGGEGASNLGRLERDDLEEVPMDNSPTTKDYAVREVDFYYGVRGPALSSGTRKLKTGPADPTGPVSSATGWFKGLFGGKTKENHKGFEVVRSARAPPPGLMRPGAGNERTSQEPYRDDPQSPLAVRQGRSGSQQSVPHRPPRENAYKDEETTSDESEPEPLTSSPIPVRPPSLPLINTVGDIELPSRIGSERSKKSRKGKRLRQEDMPSIPAIPRKSSRRNSSRDFSTPTSTMRGAPDMPAIQGSPNEHRDSQATNKSSRLPFTGDQLSSSKANRYSMGADSTASDYMHVGDEENVAPQSYTQHLRQTSSALGTHAVNDRPSSMGYVPHHRASDAIHHSPDSPDFEGSVAEVLGRPPQAR